MNSSEGKEKPMTFRVVFTHFIHLYNVSSFVFELLTIYVCIYLRAAPIAHQWKGHWMCWHHSRWQQWICCYWILRPFPEHTEGSDCSGNVLNVLSASGPINAIVQTLRLLLGRSVCSLLSLSAESTLEFPAAQHLRVICLNKLMWRINHNNAAILSCSFCWGGGFWGFPPPFVCLPKTIAVFFPSSLRWHT